MKKLKYIFLLTLVLTATLFTSCVDRLEATKYTIDTLHLKNGKKLTGTILGEDRLYFTIKEDKGSSLKVVSKDDISYHGSSDHIYQEDGKIVSCSVEEISMSLEDRNGEAVDFVLSDIQTIQRDQKREGYRVLTKSREEFFGQITSDDIGVVTKHGEKKIKPEFIQSIILNGTPKGEDQSISDLWNDLAKNMGIQNVVPKSETGRKDNGWLFTLIGILVVFIALSVMVIVFSLMKNLSSDKKKDKAKSGRVKDTKVELKDGDVHPDIVSAIALTLALSEGEEKPILTFDKNRTSSGSWAHSGRVDGTRRGDFKRS